VLYLWGEAIEPPKTQAERQALFEKVRSRPGDALHYGRDYFLQDPVTEYREGQQFRRQWAALLSEDSRITWDYHGVLIEYRPDENGDIVRTENYLNDNGYRGGRMVPWDGKVYAKPAFPGCANYDVASE
jgi:hypothetical protein